MTKLAPMMSSASGDWCTPLELLELVRQLGPIGLDPATNARNPVGAVDYFTPKEDGLVQSWRGRGLTFLNPPYGRDVARWTAKCVEEAEAGVEIVALLPARTDTAWFQRDIASAARICFLRGRLTFVGADSPAPFPSCVAYWGERPGLFESAFQEAGWVVRP